MLNHQQFYPGYGYPNYFQPQQIQPQVQTQSQQPMQIQNGGFISIRSIEEARNYPVAPGNVVTFKIENEPVVCEKSQGFSQLEAPRFDIYDLHKRDVVKPQPILEEIIDIPTVEYATKKEVDYIREDIAEIKHKLSEPRKLSAKVKKEVIEDE